MTPQSASVDHRYAWWDCKVRARSPRFPKTVLLEELEGGARYSRQHNFECLKRLQEKENITAFGMVTRRKRWDVSAPG